MSRRLKTGLKLLPVVLGLVVVALWWDAFCFEPHHPRLYREEVRLHGLSTTLDGFRILHLSDLHIVKLGKREARAARLVAEARPDVIVLTGDYIKDDGITPEPQRWEECTDEAIRFLKPLSARCGKYAVMGNWDGPQVMARLEEAGAVTRLDNRAIELKTEGGRLWLAGVPAVGPDLHGTLKHVPAADPCILLAHFPSVADAAATLGADLVLAGHYHGGQVNFPLTGPVCRRRTPYVAGLYELGDCLLYVNRGLGMHTEAVRFRCRPEVALFTVLARSRGDRRDDAALAVPRPRGELEACASEVACQMKILYVSRPMAGPMIAHTDPTK